MSELRGGHARVDITPPLGCRMMGYLPTAEILAAGGYEATANLMFRMNGVELRRSRSGYREPSPRSWTTCGRSVALRVLVSSRLLARATPRVVRRPCPPRRCDLMVLE